MRDCRLCGAKVIREGGWAKLFHNKGCTGFDAEGQQEGRDGTDESQEMDFKVMHSRGDA